MLRRNERDMIKDANFLSHKIPIILVHFYWNLNIRDMFSKDTQVPNFMRIRLVALSCSMWTDGQTDMTKLTVAFRNSPYTRKDCPLLCPSGISFTILYC